MTNDLLDEAARRAAAYLDGLGERSVFPTPEALRGLDRFAEPLPDGPCDPLETLRLLDAVGSPATIATAGPALLRLRDRRLAAGDRSPPTGSPAPGTRTPAWSPHRRWVACLERVALGWLLDVLGLPAGTAAAFVTGATMANFTGLAAARHAVLRSAGWDVEADGLFGAPPVTVVVGAEAHATRAQGARACSASDASASSRVPVDGQGRMRADALPRALRARRSCACRPAT